ncbi:class I SAM-dependent methyltransferase [Amycolatopsis thermoflava]|uniref:class I SAM-dependent methyltransferase n=1 Tax=Amycolatopsis thermoflava TaxID=84480 RepID=UPI00366A30B4
MSDVQGDTLLQSQALEDLTGAVNYRRWLCSLGAPFFGDEVLEIGSGLGDYAADWADMGFRVTATEADPGRLAALRKRFDGHERVVVRRLTVPVAATAHHSAVVAYNVLEHIPDDVAALRSFANLARPGGAVVLIVPAFAFAMSEFDRAVGHQRRYRVPVLARAMTRAGLRVQRCHYVNGPGLVAWFVMCRVLRSRPKDGPLLRAYDRFYVPVERRLESTVRMPFGQSVFAVGRVPQ